MLTSSASALTPSKQLLVVDDSPIVHHLYERFLEQLDEPVAVTFATNGWEGLRALKALKGEVSLIFLDIDMPIMGGEAFLKVLSQLPAYDHIPVVLASSSAALPGAFMKRVSGKMPKPFDARALCAAITTWSRP